MNRLPPWNRLATLARRAPAEPAPEPAAAFVTRIVARGLALRNEKSDILAAFGLRALGLALAVMVVTAVATYPVLQNGATAVDEEDPVAEMVAQL